MWVFLSFYILTINKEERRKDVLYKIQKLSCDNFCSVFWSYKPISAFHTLKYTILKWLYTNIYAALKIWSTEYSLLFLIFPCHKSIDSWIL